MDLRIAHCEITQGIQVHGNTVPLVEGKPTVVRVIPRTDATPPISGVTAKLYAVRPDGTQLGPIDPRNGPIEVSDDYWRGDPNDSLDFLLESAWCEGPMQFRAELQDPAGNSTSPGHTVLLDAEFHARRSFSLRYVVVEHGDTPISDDVKDIQACNFLRSVFPMNPLEFSYEPASTPTLVFEHTQGNDIDDAKLIQELNMVYLGDPLADAVYGWVAEGVFGDSGRSDPRYMGGQGRVAFGNSKPSRYRRTLAHELGHNALVDGLDHPSTDPDSPSWYPAQLQDDEFGYDVLGVHPTGQTVLRTDGDGQLLYDMMEPAKEESQAWIGPRNYRMLFDAFDPDSSVAAAGPGQPTGGGGSANDHDAENPELEAPDFSPDAAFLHVINGVVRLDGSAELMPARPVPSSSRLSAMLANGPGSSGDLELRFFKPAGSRKFQEVHGSRIGWTPSFVDAEGDPADAWFSWLIRDWPKEIARIQLVGNGHVLAELRKSRGESVGISEDTVVVEGDDVQGALQIRWEVKLGHRASPLYQQVYYRKRTSQLPGDESWHLIASAITSMRTDLSIPAAQLPGGVGGDLMLLASTGFDGDSHEVSTRTASLAQPPAEPRIIAPERRAVQRSGEHFLLLGYALDPDGVRVKPERLRWLLESRDSAGEANTPLGFGESVVVRERISPGSYALVLRVEDGQRTAIDLIISA